MTTRRQGQRPEEKNFYFTVEFRLDLFSATMGLRPCPSLMCNDLVQF